MKLVLLIFLIPISLYSPSYAGGENFCYGDPDCEASSSEYDPSLSVRKPTVVPDPQPGLTYAELQGLGAEPFTPDGEPVVVSPPNPATAVCVYPECDSDIGDPAATTEEGLDEASRAGTSLVPNKVVCQECETEEAIANLTAEESAPAAAKPCNVVSEDGTCEEDLPSEEGTGAGAI